MISVVTVLFKKKTAELSRGYYNRGAEVSPSNRSRYNTKPAAASCAIGMGIVQAVLAVLSGHVERFSWCEEGRTGTAHLTSTSSASDYDFSWDEMDPELGLYGGFANGPTYQLAILHLILCFLDRYHGGSDRSAEVMERWFKLVDGMARYYPGGRERGNGWSKQDVGDACRNGEVRPLIEQVADSMWFTLRYRLPELSLDRAMDLYPAQIVPSPLDSPTGSLGGASLFVQPRAAAGGTAKSRRVRQQLSLALDEVQLARFAAAREERMVGVMPVCHFPGPADMFE